MSARRSKATKMRLHSLPQACPKCECDLSDPSVPPEREEFRHLFSLVLSDGSDWLCPVCGHRWPRR